MSNNNFTFDSEDTSTTSGISYDYNIPKEYRGTTTHSISCYKKANQYGACQNSQIVPPSPTSPMPEMFRYMKPHPMPKQNIRVNTYIPQNRDYYNKVLYGSNNSTYDLANKNTKDTYRVISMGNEVYTCGGLGSSIYTNPSEFKLGFNDVVAMNNANYFY